MCKEGSVYATQDPLVKKMEVNFNGEVAHVSKKMEVNFNELSKAS